jgi:hypothetical protein
VSIAKTAERGIVKTQAQRIFLATPHLTAEKPFTEPTPMIEPVMVCVVLTGMPHMDASDIVIPEAVSALNPPKGVSLVTRIPRVLMTFHPRIAHHNNVERYMESMA